MENQTNGKYKMSTVSSMTGFSPELLRAWERRHALLDPRRSSGGHRFYTEDDLNVLRRIRSMLDEGRAIGEIAALGRARLLANESPVSARNSESVHSSADVAVTARDRGALEHCREQVIEAAIAMDKTMLDRALDDAFSLVSPDIVIRQMLQPAARQIGDLWMTGRCTVASEHLASEAFCHRLRKLIESATGTSRGSRLALCACFPEDNHQLGLLIFAYQLSIENWDVVYLGPSLPFEDLRIAADRLHPDVVVVSVAPGDIYLKHRLEFISLADKLSAPVKVVGGPGVPADDEEVSNAGYLLWPEPKGTASLVEYLNQGNSR